MKTAARTNSYNSLGVSPGDYAAYGSGTIIHADVVDAGPENLATVDVAFSGAAFSSVPRGAYENEMERSVSPILDAAGGFARGSGVDLGLLFSTPGPLLNQLSEAKAPPSPAAVQKVLGPIAIPDLLSLELLRTKARARSADEGCVLGSNLSYGFGSVAKLDLLDSLISSAALPPLREVSQSTSRSWITPSDGRLGLTSEVRETVAPVTLFQGTPAQFTIEVLGEWVLRLFSDGAKSTVHYGPNETSPESPVVRIFGGDGKEMAALTLQQLLGDEGLELTIPGVAEIVVGEDPRVIDGDASSKPKIDSGLAIAATDIVRVKLLQGALADVRVGHMEAAVNVPAGGVPCPGIEVTHTVSPENVTPGQEYEYTIVVNNPNDCALSSVKLVETITGPDGSKYEILSTDPSGVISGSTATIEDLGDLAAGESKTVTVKVKVLAGSAPGQLSANAVATGVCEPPADEVDASVPIPVTGDAEVDGPTVNPLFCTVPNIVTLTPEAAAKLLAENGCKLGKITTDDEVESDKVGTILDQTPDAGGDQLPPGSTVDIVVGGPVCIVSDLTGLTRDEAEAALVKAGCKLGTVTVDTTGDQSKIGDVVDQGTDPGSVVPVGTPVGITVGGPACLVPNLDNLSEADAKTAIIAAGCTVGPVTLTPGGSDDVGKVVGQGPAAGKVVELGTPVSLSVGDNATARVAGAVSEPLTAAAPAADAGGSALPKTGGVALLSLATMLTAAGVVLRLAGRRNRPSSNA